MIWFFILIMIRVARLPRNGQRDRLLCYKMAFIDLLLIMSGLWILIDRPIANPLEKLSSFETIEKKKFPTSQLIPNSQNQNITKTVVVILMCERLWMTFIKGVSGNTKKIVISQLRFGIYREWNWNFERSSCKNLRLIRSSNERLSVKLLVLLG